MRERTREWWASFTIRLAHSDERERYEGRLELHRQPDAGRDGVTALLIRDDDKTKLIGEGRKLAVRRGAIAFAIRDQTMDFQSS